MSTRRITSQALRVSYILILSLILPAAARAAVTINEVMYDPLGTNAKHSWLELYNDSDVAFDISKWTVTDGATGSSGALTKHALNVPPKNGGIGSATIPAGGYVIIADDAVTFEAAYPSVPNVIDSVFSISNPDQGAQVRLLDAQSSAVDSFSFSADTYASNKGNSLQRSGASLVSALPTPAAANATEAYIPPDEGSDDSGSSASKTPSTSSILPPAPVVFADAGADRTVIVGADTSFRAMAYTSDKVAFKSAKFLWTFGDGGSAEGALVMHHFSYPGRYAVELYITNQKYSAASHVVVTAKEAVVAVSMLAGGGVSVQNRTERDLDLSYWLVRQGTATFKLPEHSVVLAGEAINISQETLGFAATDAKLLYPNEAEVALASAAEPAPAPTTAPDEPVAAAQIVDAPLIVPTTYIEIPAASAPEASSIPSVSKVPANTELAASVAISEAKLPMWTALAGLGGIMGLGVASVYAVRRRPATHEAAKEFDIE